MASVKWLRQVVDLPWPVPDFIWKLREVDSRWRDPCRRAAGLLRVVLYYVHGFVFQLFVWVSAVDDMLTIPDDQ
jgi:hypothetical protein